MRKLISIAFLGLVVGPWRPAFAACDSSPVYTYTTNAGIVKPPINACGWGTTINSDWDILDSSSAFLAKANTFTKTNTFSAGISVSTLAVSGATTIQSASPILSTQTLQTGTTFYVSSGTVNTLTISTISVSGAGQGYLLLYSTTVFDVSGSSATQTAVFAKTKTCVSITPKRTTSRIEVSWGGSLRSAVANGTNALGTILRDNTNLATAGDNAFCQTNGPAAAAVTATCSGDILDSPNTTSLITYCVAIVGSNTTNAVSWNASSEVGAITVKEWGY